MCSKLDGRSHFFVNYSQNSKIVFLETNVKTQPQYLFSIALVRWKEKNKKHRNMSTLLAKVVWPSYRKKRQSFTYFWQKVMRAKINADFAYIKNYVAAVLL